MIRPSHFWHWIAVGFGSGLAPKAPGTFGTLAALPLVAVAWWSFPLWAYVLVGLGLGVVGIIACDRTARDFATKDPSYVVIDEWVGMWFSVLALPFSFVTLALAFVWFRFFDIVKPWPVRWADQKLGGGVGIMMDDVIAGGMTCVCLHGLAYFY